MVILENIDIDIDIDKAILQNIDIDKISNRFKFGISNRATQQPPRLSQSSSIDATAYYLSCNYHRVSILLCMKFGIPGQISPEAKTVAENKTI